MANLRRGATSIAHCRRPIQTARRHVAPLAPRLLLAAGLLLAAAPAPDQPDPALTLLERPLFSPGRRPATEAVAPAGVAEAPPLPRLSATVVTAGGERMASLWPAGAARPVTLHEGERAGGLLVLRITAGAIEAEGPSGRLTLRVGYGIDATPVLPDPRTHGTTEQDE